MKVCRAETVDLRAFSVGSRLKLIAEGFGRLAAHKERGDGCEVGGGHDEAFGGADVVVDDGEGGSSGGGRFDFIDEEVGPTFDQSGFAVRFVVTGGLARPMSTSGSAAWGCRQKRPGSGVPGIEASWMARDGAGDGDAKPRHRGCRSRRRREPVFDERWPAIPASGQVDRIAGVGDAETHVVADSQSGAVRGQVGIELIGVARGQGEDHLDVAVGQFGVHG